MLPDTLIPMLVGGTLLPPALAFFTLATLWVLGQRPSEDTTARVIQAATSTTALSALALAFLSLVTPALPRDFELPPWFELHGYAFEASLHIDALSVTFMSLVAVLTAITARFSVTYLHREPGYFRYFLLLTLFEAGMLQFLAAGSYGQLFLGWEVVGLTSVLLVGFFHTRTSAIRASLRVLLTYRSCDVGLLLGLVLLHQAFHSSSYGEIFADIRAPHAATTAIACMLLLGSMGKAAQLPFSGWLPRAMEGPTPSSALFYGALSVHGGVYLLLRSAPVFEAAPLARVGVVLVGAATALHATLLVRVQTDPKGNLAYASMAQLGVMFVECGLGFHTLALVHVVGHACLRSFQLLRAPSALHDLQSIRSSVVGLAGDLPSPLAPRLLPSWGQRVLWKQVHDRFQLEVLVDRLVLQPLLRVARSLDHAERAWERVLSPAHRPRRDQDYAPGARSTVSTDTLTLEGEA